MTVGVDLALRVREYPGDNSATPRPVPFKFLSNDDLKVTRVNADGSETVLLRGTDFTVSGADTPTGGEVTPLAFIAVGTSWRIEGEMPLAQPTDYTAGDDFPAESHERGLDRAMIGLQEARRDVSDTRNRSFLVPRGEAGGVLPRAADRIGKYQAFDAAGNPVMASGTGGGDAALRGDLALPAGSLMVGFSEGAAPAVPQSVSQAVSALVRTGKSGLLSTAGQLDDHRAGVLAYRKMVGGQVELVTDLSRFYPEGYWIDPHRPDQPAFIEYVGDTWTATGNPDIWRHKFTGWTGAGLGVLGRIYAAEVVDVTASRVYTMTPNMFGDYEAKVWWDQVNGFPNLDIRMPSGVSPPAAVKVRIGFYTQPLRSLYVDPVNGDDRNTGRSFEWALKTINEAIARAPKAIFIKPGLYGLTNEIGTYAGADIAIKCIGGRANFVPQFTSFSAWAADTGGAYVSTVGGSPTPVGAIDLGDYDEFGLPYLLKNAGSIAACRATEGTYYWDAAGPRKMYVHLRGGRVPTNDKVMPYRSAVLFRHSAPGAKVYVSDCTFVSGSGGAVSARDANTAAVLIAERVAGIGSWNTNGFDIQGIGLAILIRCLANKNVNDGFNYTRGLEGIDPHFIEIGCVGKDNIAGGTNNGSTSHNSVRGFRINCDYSGSSGPGVADTNDAKTMNVNVSSCFNGPNASACGYQASENAVQIIDGGCAYGNAGPDFSARDAASVIRYRDCSARTQGGAGSVVPL